MTVSLDQLHAFVATVENGGLAQAARRVGKHVSTLREQVNNLEIDTGLCLFVRHPRSLELTANGEQLYSFAKSMLSEANHFDAKVESLLQGIPDKLTIAIDTSLIDPALDQLISQLLKDYPYLSLKVLNGDTLQIRGWVLAGKADIGLMLSTIHMPTEIMLSNAYSFEVVRVVPASWQLSSPAQPRELRERLQLSYSFLQDIGMRDADVMGHRYMLCNNAMQLLNLVKAGVGWAHLPRFICDEALASGDVLVNQQTDEQFSNWNAELVWQKERAVNPAMQSLIQAVQLLPNR
ncbi:LysR family transcriptional regulator [Alginatibacterium sediminis]|uniref:LysR family transcriptional regulator n=1 Tax=Alginatibacterium sediminis TaxID=2164068 RepID=A0A420EI58_9ALTE|nr:LysR family transcriptional regulator [Alginatibacterium sediminis]RKF20337.1 LysR family transcriptional regulator [Alginatibacterium sediminis]